jgi:catechol 2,3-dioxygenase-like lactoylglutathione lyase family enzyme
MPALRSLMESARYVSDLERAMAFYRDVLGLRLMEKFDANRGAAFQVGETVLLLFRAEETRKGGWLPPHGAAGQGHVAFRVEPSDLDDWRRHLREHGVEIEQEFAFAGNPPAIYFRDPDGNLLELAVATIWAFQ